MSKNHHPPQHTGTAMAGLALFCWVVTSFPVLAAAVETVERFGFWEISLQADGRYDNPFTDLTAHAVLTGPDGSVRSLPLFWDGGDTWKLCCAQPRGKDRRVKVRMSPSYTRTVRRPPRTAYWLLAEPGRHYILYARACREYAT